MNVDGRRSGGLPFNLPFTPWTRGPGLPPAAAQQPVAHLATPRVKGVKGPQSDLPLTGRSRVKGIRNPKWGAGLWANLVCQEGDTKSRGEGGLSLEAWGLRSGDSGPVLRMERFDTRGTIEAIEASPDR